jgi:N-acetylglucosaminyl-diphospho-decaprenol L-rhamnosyltransferase
MTDRPAPRPPTPATATVAVVIVNYRTGALTVEALASLAPQVAQRPGTRVLVVDNASGDDSCALISAAIAERGWGAWAALLPAERNGGFAAGNNLAVRTLKTAGQPPDAVWLLNPDTRARPGALEALAAHLSAHRLCGIAGSLLLDDDGGAWPFAFRFPSLLGEVDAVMRLGPVSWLLRRHVIARRMALEAPAEVDWVSGASMMVRWTVFETVGLMDEDYFLYFEETDFARRARQRGWQCWFVPGSQVVHLSGQSTGVTGEHAGRRRRPGYWFESRRRYFEKHHGRLYALLTDLAHVGSGMVWHLARVLRGRPNTDPPHFLRDLLRHSALLRPGRAP